MNRDKEGVGLNSARETRAVPGVTHESEPPYARDVLHFLGRLGLKSLGAKVFVAGLVCGGLSLVIFGAVSYWRLSGALEAGGTAPQAGLTSALPGHFLLAAGLAFGVLVVVTYAFSASVTSGVRRLSEAAELVRSGGAAPVVLKTGDELEKIAGAFNRVANGLSETSRTQAEQRQALVLLKQAIESSGDAIAVTDLQGGSSYYNQTFVDLTGFAADELFSRDGACQLYGDRTVAQKIQDTVKAGYSWSGEVELKARGERFIPVNLRTNCIRDEAGDVIGRIAVHTDITERRRMEESILNSEAQYRLAFDGNPRPMWVFDTETLGFLAVNQAALRHYGYSLEEFLSKTINDIRPEEDGEKLVLESDRSEWKTDQRVWRHRLKDGRLIYVEISSQELRFEGRPARLVLADDVSDRRQMEEALRKSELEYRNLFESANDPIMILEPDTERILEANSRACSAYGYSRKELVGMTLKHLTKDGQAGDTRVEDALKGETRSFETIHLKRDGTPIHILASLSGIEYRGNKAVLGIARDITGRKEAEEIFQRSLDEFLSLVSMISEGELTSRGNEADGPLSAVSKSINRMLENFSGMLTRVKQIGLSITSSATEILAAAEQIAVGAQRQADEVTNTSSAVEEMAASMNQVSRNAEASAESARRALGMAEHGDRSVKDTSEAMVRISAAVQLTAEKMRLLAKRSSEISEIIDLINDVASQTNLLSLNAAIEAAHAGEAGLGFSVVAEEIRKLAERSARATRDVGNLIKAIQRETSEALEAMENGMKEVKGGSTLAEQARQSLQDISNVVRQSAELVEEISTASEEQARVTRDLAVAMQTVSSITLETSAGAHETAQTIQGMVNLSEQLNDAISQFRVKDNFVHPFSYETAGQEGGSGPAVSKFAGSPGGD